MAKAKKKQKEVAEKFYVLNKNRTVFSDRVSGLKLVNRVPGKLRVGAATPKVTTAVNKGHILEISKKKYLKLLEDYERGVLSKLEKTYKSAGKKTMSSDSLDRLRSLREKYPSLKTHKKVEESKEKSKEEAEKEKPEDKPLEDMKLVELKEEAVSRLDKTNEGYEDQVKLVNSYKSKAEVIEFIEDLEEEEEE